MKTSEKRMIAILIAITIVVIIVAIVISNGNKNKNEEVSQTTEEATQIYDDGTTVNNSDKLHETKKLEGMEINNIQLTEKDGETMLIGTANNNSDAEQGGYVASIKMIDKQGNEIAAMEAYIGTVKQGKSLKFSTSATFDSSSVYDFTITKK